MPGIALCGKKTHIASDDLPFISWILLFLHVAWVAVLASYVRDVNDCPSNKTAPLQAFGIAALAVHILNCVCELLLTLAGVRGTPMQHSKRSAVQPLLFGRVALLCTDLAVTVFGTVTLRQRQSLRCLTSESEQAAIVIVSVNWAVIVVISLLLFAALSPLLYLQQPQWEKELDSGHEGLLRCCNALAGNEHSADPRPAADAISRGFPTGLDLTLSDTVAGLALLGIEQEVESQALSRSAAQDRCDGVIRGVSGERAGVFGTRTHLDTASWLCKYSLAAYGWPLLCYSAPSHSLHTICCGCAPHRSCSDRSAAARFIGCNEDNVHVHIPEGGVQYVAASNATGERVLALRGTLSIGDALRDFDYAAEPLDQAELAGLGIHQGWAHRGMLFAARAVYAHLLRQDPDFYSSGEGRRIYVVGHSLGAGVASLLSIFLKSDGWNVIAQLYAPPGTVVSSEVADSMADFATGIFMQSDLITRLSPNNFERLRRRMVIALSRCKVNKQWLWLRIALRRIWPLQAHQLLVSSAETPGEEAERRRDDALSILMEAPLERSPVPLWPPGKSLNLVRLKAGRASSSLQRRRMLSAPTATPSYGDYWPRWENKDARDEYGIEVSQTMFHDHMPDRLNQVILQLHAELGASEEDAAQHQDVQVLTSDWEQLL